MAKRKKAPAATYTYVRDEKVPARTPKTGKTTAKYKRTGGIKKVKTSAEKGAPRKNVVTPTRPADLIASELAGQEAKELGVQAFAKSQERDFGDPRISRQLQLAEHIEALPGSGESREGRAPTPSRSNVTPGVTPGLVGRYGSGVRRRGRAMGPLIPVTNAASVATVPASGTGAGSAPAQPDTGAEVGGAMVVGKGAGAPDARTTSGTSTSVREMRSAKNIKQTQRKARRRLPGGLRTTEYRPMDIAGKNTSGTRKQKRAQDKLNKRIAKGKVKLRKGVVKGAAEAEAYTAQTVANKAGIDVKDLPSRDASAFVYSDESMAQELARKHFKDKKLSDGNVREGHSASDIMEYVKSTGSTMTAFHTHVMNSVKATKKKYDIKVGPPEDERIRSAGKITRWKVDPTSESGFTEISSYRGFQRKKSRNEEGANVKGWVKLSAPPNKGTISHLDYLHHQIQKWKENRALEQQDSREINRQRRQDRATAHLVDAMSGGATVGGTGPGRTVRNAGGNSINRPPKGRSKRYVTGKKNPDTGKITDTAVITPEKPTFTEVKPNKKRLNYE